VAARVEKMVPGGLGLARHEGQVVFVEGGLPGETVEIELSEAKGGYRKSRLVRVAEPAAERVAPVCPHYGACGGCDLQHASHAAQLAYKRAMLEDSLRRQGGYGLDSPLPEIAILAGEPWGYRNRMQFHRAPETPDRVPRYGLKRRSSETIEPIDDCLVASMEIRHWLREAPRAGTEAPERLMVYGAQGRLATGNGEFGLTVAGRDLSFAVDGFFQSNAALLGVLAGLMSGWLERIGPVSSAADLYCGCGVFAALLPPGCGRIEAVDSNPANCRYARANTDPARTTVFEGDVDAWLAGRPEGFPELVIVDPPRTGLSRRLLGQLCAEAPRHLFFVSCDPVTFCRDLKELRTTGYAVRELALLDFYPQTAHIETACWLEHS
jgi:23S rRNA (uracil1939-C5)-methyltransferase